ncbi:DUF3445 domain-containing protein [Terrilactibacillus sp. BCM23-1]|uniref:DUF3445 domain-containing protein n=1 Tax=Terrilactibacillus tamarindi TaxID=2599694 RepID=A0A6N8CUN6_9BACI|nr:DUF3445 domain-containing protein [Terrilactibacillus tamarindi]MTT32815.1 DUF3445 domain-containing protein [Terrilactibacillus tamarindi]
MKQLKEDIDEFPFPFKSNDPYRFSNNSIPLNPPISIDVTSKYIEEIKLKRDLLKTVHNRCYQSTPDTYEAQWEVLNLVMHHLSDMYPDRFKLKKEKDHWSFTNLITNETESFIYRDNSSLTLEPLDVIGRHVQEDLLILMEKDNELYLEAGQLCFPGRWSLVFKLGMTFLEIHQPIPEFNDTGLGDKIRRFLLNLEAGNPFERLNWALTIGYHLDTSIETFHKWGHKQKEVTPENVGSLVHLRVERQKLFRLPKSNSILFNIHTYLLSFEDLVQNPEWRSTFYDIFTNLPDYILKYKGAYAYKDTLIEYLKKFQQHA